MAMAMHLCGPTKYAHITEASVLRAPIVGGRVEIERVALVMCVLRFMGDSMHQILRKPVSHSDVSLVGTHWATNREQCQNDMKS